METLALAADRLARQAHTTVVDNRERWLVDAARRREEARENERETLEAWFAARWESREAAMAEAWLREFPQRVAYKPPNAGALPGVRGQNGDPIPFEPVAQALREELDPPERPTPDLPLGGAAKRFFQGADAA